MAPRIGTPPLLQQHLKNLLDPRCAAVVHNLHVIARQPSGHRYQLAA